MDALHYRVIAQIKRLAERQKISLSHLPDRAGVARSHYWEVLAGKKSPTLKWLNRIAQALEIDIAAFFATNENREAPQAEAKVKPFRLRRLTPREEQKYDNCAPLYSLKAAAGGLSEGQGVTPQGWVEVASQHKLRAGMFVAKVVGKSMEPIIPDGAYCLFQSPVQGDPQGRTLLVQHRDIRDPDHVGSYTVKRFFRSRGSKQRVELRSINRDYEAMTFSPSDAGELSLIAELLEVLG